MLIDTHCHIFLPEFETDRSEVIRRAINNGVEKFFLPNVDSSTINPLLDLAQKYPGTCYPMIGLHPTSVKEDYTIELQHIQDRFNKDTFYAIGETGIDLYWNQGYLNEQTDAFIAQINMAKTYCLPIIIHSRNSFREIFSIMDEHHDNSLTGIFHSFTGTIEQAEKIISYGFKIGIGGIVTFKNSGVDKVVQGLGLEHIVLETDSPYLAPSPNRGKRNEPGWLVYTAMKVAELHNCPLEEIAAITSQNAMDVYKLNKNQ